MFSEYNLKIKYDKKFKIVMSNVIFKKFNMIKRIFINTIVSFNAIMKEIDE